MGFWKINGLPQQNRNNRKISSIPVPIIWSPHTLIRPPDSESSFLTSNKLTL
jgi:hypothetical protein